ncbi:MAG: hypothetical protein LC808_21560, partial [Actinobacteria bacterium]|nr:hypothetical protein [Actinomycetota bacterium]
MRRLSPPFKFDLTTLLGRFRSLPLDVDAIATIGLPGFKVTVRLDDVERRVARELVIRLADRRVLNAWECCDSCIVEALKSIQEIRRLLVDKQVDLAHRTDSALYLLIELMAEGIRQFLTFEQSLSIGRDDRAQVQESYFAGLEMLRAHLHRSLRQVAVVAGMQIPSITEAMCYDDSWD